MEVLRFSSILTWAFIILNAQNVSYFLEKYYNADADKGLVGGSVPATEHSVMCMGTLENEVDTFRRLITEVYPAGVVSIVSDTWDLWKVITEYLPILKNEIQQREHNTLAKKVDKSSLQERNGTYTSYLL